MARLDILSREGLEQKQRELDTDRQKLRIKGQIISSFWSDRDYFVWDCFKAALTLFTKSSGSIWYLNI